MLAAGLWRHETVHTKRLHTERRVSAVVSGSLSAPFLRPAPRGVQRQLGAVPEAQLAQYLRDVVLGSPLAYVQLGGYLGVGRTLAD